jgi:hypothetical protein
VNVPVGVLAVMAGWFLLPRTKHRSARQGSDPPGLALLAVAPAGSLIAISAVSGLGLPALPAAASALIAVAGTAGLAWWERRSAAPLLDLPMLTPAGLAPALAGALCVYLVLFGPLVLFPQILAAQHETALQAGLLLTALPAGFGLAALAAERLLPATWPNRRRCRAGGTLACLSVTALAIPAPAGVTALLPGLLGIGLGTYIPASNAQIMAAASDRDAAAAGGMVNMTRG